MTSTQVAEFKSKEACPRCQEHKLFTNDVQKDAPFVRYHCLSCNYEFSQKVKNKVRKKKKTERSEQYLGMLFVVVTMFVIVLITLDNQRQADQVEPALSSRIELLRRWIS